MRDKPVKREGKRETERDGEVKCGVVVVWDGKMSSAN
jgi:hypothetical protein